MAAALTLDQHGACHLPYAAQPILASLDGLAEQLSGTRGGHRIEGNAVVRAVTEHGALLHGLAAERIGAGARAVRAILFDKSDGANWALGWHQDRTIAVEERHDVAGFGPWTIKAGMAHVARRLLACLPP